MYMHNTNFTYYISIYIYIYINIDMGSRMSSCIKTIGHKQHLLAMSFIVLAMFLPKDSYLCIYNHQIICAKKIKKRSYKCCAGIYISTALHISLLWRLYSRSSTTWDQYAGNSASQRFGWRWSHSDDLTLKTAKWYRSIVNDTVHNTYT